MDRQKINLQYGLIVSHDFELSKDSHKWSTLFLDNWITCVKKWLSMDHGQIVDSAIYE